MGLMDSLLTFDQTWPNVDPSRYDPESFSGKYNTPIPEDKQQDFVQWLTNLSMKSGADRRQDANDYDIQGAFMDSLGTDGRGHMGDKFKKPNHPTFSDQSQYNGVDGYQGGHWGDNYFIPSDTNLKMSGQEFLKNYFQNVEPGTSLYLPIGGTWLDILGGTNAR